MQSCLGCHTQYSVFVKAFKFLKLTPKAIVFGQQLAIDPASSYAVS